MSDRITLINTGKPGLPGVGVSAGQYAGLAPKASPTFTGTATFEGNVNLGNSTTDTITITGHLELLGSAPSVAVGTNAATGTGSAASVVYGNDTSGQISVTTGNAAVAGSFCTITFTQNRANTNYSVMISPADPDASAALLYHDFANNAVGSCRIRCSNAPGTATTLLFNYLILG